MFFHSFFFLPQHPGMVSPKNYPYSPMPTASVSARPIFSLITLTPVPTVTLAATPSAAASPSAFPRRQHSRPHRPWWHFWW